MLRTKHRQSFLGGKVSEAYRPTDATGIGVVLPGAIKSSVDYHGSVMADSPAYYVTFDGSDGSDASGNAKNFTAVGTPTFGATGAILSAPSGKQANFSGNTVCYSRAYDAALSVAGGDFTVEGWIKPVTLAGTWAAMGNYSGSLGWVMYIGATGTVQFRVESVDGDNDCVTAAGLIANGVWAHVVCTYVNSTRVQTVYVNGVNVKTNTMAHVVSVATSTGFNLNDRGIAGSGFGAACSLDECAFWTRDIGATRVGVHYASSGH